MSFYNKSCNKKSTPRSLNTVNLWKNQLNIIFIPFCSILLICSYAQQFWFWVPGPPQELLPSHPIPSLGACFFSYSLARVFSPIFLWETWTVCICWIVFGLSTIVFFCYCVALSSLQFLLKITLTCSKPHRELLQRHSSPELRILSRSSLIAPWFSSLTEATLLLRFSSSIDLKNRISRFTALWS